MGLKVPEEPPELPPDDLFDVIYTGYVQPNCQAPAPPAGGTVLGSDLNAYYAAGGDCVLNNYPDPLVIFVSARVHEVTPHIP